MFKLIKYLKNYKIQCIVAPLFKFLEASFEIVIPILTSLIIDKGINVGGTPNKALVYKYTALMLGMGVLGLTVALIAQYFSAVAGVGIGTVLRKECFYRLNRMSLADIDRLGQSSIVSKLTLDINQVSNGVNRFLRLFLRAPFIIIGAIISSFILNVYMGIIILVGVPVILFIVWFIGKLTVPRFKSIQQDNDDISRISKENVEGVKVIRAFNAEDGERRNFDELSDNLAKKQIGASKISSLLNPLTYVIANLMIIVVVYLGVGKVKTGIMTAGEITAMVNYILQILNAIFVLSNMIILLSKAQASAIRLNEFLSVPLSEDLNGNGDLETNEKGTISFENVSFSYNDQTSTLENVSFDVKTGETIGIIGGTGSGKTTLINLISGLYKIDEGKIKIDGVDINAYSNDQLRKKISVAFQRFDLFDGTVESNLKVANPDATEDDMLEALKTAMAYDFVMQKDGLDTAVLEGGTNFSGGQKQRLNIARALTKKSEILILDDSFSALDYATDLSLRKNLKNIQDLTVLIISQRVSSVMGADKILVLEDGKIAGLGKHADLYETCEEYKEICDLQSIGGGNE